MTLDASELRIAIDGTEIVSDASLRVGAGEIVGIVGPNGSGKSTLLRSFYRALRPQSGWVRVDGDDVWAMSARAAAQRTSAVTQESHGDFDLTVNELVAMGRTPHKGAFDRDSIEDRRIVDAALARVEMSAFTDRLFATLSGGEKQRVLVARALAQEPHVMVLDEPTNHLDIRAQLDLMELLRDVGVTAVLALHDLNLAVAYCSRIYVMCAGRVVAEGAPVDVLSPEVLRDVFGVEASCGIHEATGRHHIVFAPLRRTGGTYGKTQIEEE